MAYYRFLFYKASVNTDELVHVGNDTGVEYSQSFKPWHVGQAVPPRPKGPSVSADLFEHVDNPLPTDEFVPFHVVTMWRSQIFTPLPTPKGATVNPTTLVHDENPVNVESLVRYQPPWFQVPLPRPYGTAPNGDLLVHVEPPYDTTDCAWLVPSTKPFHVGRDISTWKRPRGSAVIPELYVHDPNRQCWHEETLESGSWTQETLVETCS